MALEPWRELIAGLDPLTRTIRVGVTGLARAGKTAFLTSVYANLMAAGAGLPVLPMLTNRLAGRRLRVALAPALADTMPRFDGAAHVAALAADPPRWPARTDAVSLLALDLEIGRTGLAAVLPDQRWRLELLDYPGEWLIDLPLLRQDFAGFADTTLRRLEPFAAARDFLAFASALPADAPADDALAGSGHALYRAALTRLRDEGLSLLQPGRFITPAPGPEPPWIAFFPLRGSSPLALLLRRRYEMYVAAVRRELSDPLFGRLDRLIVLADVLTALHAGPLAFADARAALGTVGQALRWRNGAGLPDWLSALAPLLALLPGFGGISRVAFAATKTDHVAERQRGNLAALMGGLTGLSKVGDAATRSFAIASMRCTEDIVWTLDGRPVSAVRGRVAGTDRPARSYPGEVPDTPPQPDAAFWSHRFLSLPDFEPLRLHGDGRAGVPNIGLDALLTFLLDDLL